MTSTAANPRTHRLRRPAVAILTQLPLLLGLVLLWIVLWGNIAPITIITGVVFSLAVVRIFTLPPVVLSGRIHLGYALVLLGKVLWWLLSATFQMAWLAVRPKQVPQSSIIAEQLRVHSDWLLTLCAEIHMLIPGSVVVEVDRHRGIIYLHVLHADTEERVAQARADATAVEDVVVKALGNREHIARVNDERASRGERPLYSSRRQRAYEAKRRNRHAHREGVAE